LAILLLLASQLSPCKPKLEIVLQINPQDSQLRIPQVWVIWVIKIGIEKPQQNNILTTPKSA